MSDIGKLNSINSIKAAPLGEKSNKVSEEKLREVADLYENHFIREMVKQMRSTVHEGGLVKQNNAEKIFREQLDDEYADKWGKAGGIGLSNLIYDQLIDKFGPKMGLKHEIEKPRGPLNIDQKSNYSGIPVGQTREELLNSIGLNSSKINSDSLSFKFQSPPDDNLKLENPWAGTLLDKKYLEMDQMQYRIKHDNGLESLILTRGTGLGPEHKVSPGDSLQPGQQLGWVGKDSPLFWTVKPSVSE